MRRNLLLTRPRPQAEAFFASLSADAQRNASVCYAPLVAIEPVVPQPVIPAFDRAIFTSVNGVRYSPAGQGKPAFCVGQRTGDAAQERGWQIVECTDDAAALLPLLLKNEAAGHTIHFSGRHRRVEIAEVLIRSGQNAETRVVYEQNLVPMTEEAQALFGTKTPVLVPLFSPRTAQHFMQQVRNPLPALVLAMSDAVAREIDPTQVQMLEIAAKPTAAEMRRSIEILLSQTSLS